MKTIIRNTPKGLNESKNVTKCGGSVVGNVRKDLENQLGKNIIGKNSNFIGFVRRARGFIPYILMSVKQYCFNPCCNGIFSLETSN